MSRIQESIVELNKGFATAFIDHSLSSNGGIGKVTPRA